MSEMCLTRVDKFRLQESAQPRPRGRPRKIRPPDPEYELPPSDESSDGVPVPDLGILAAAAERLFDHKG